MATAKQKAWRAKFARLYGGKKKRAKVRKRVRRVKVRKMRVRKRSRPVKATRKRGMKMLGGINKKGAIFTLAMFYLANGIGEVQSIINNKFSKWSIRDSLWHMRQDHALPYYGLLASIYKWGDSGVLNALGMNDVTIHRKPAAIYLWAINDWAVSEPLTNAINDLQTGNTQSAVANLQKAATGSYVSDAALGLATYKWGFPISIKGVNA